MPSSWTPTVNLCGLASLRKNTRLAGCLHRWDGRTDAGTGPGRRVPAPRPSGRAAQDDRRAERLSPRHGGARVELVSLAPRILSPDGDGRRDSATLEISLGETARPIVLVDGDRAEFGRLAERAIRARLVGHQRGTDLANGTYVVGVEARDRAGNLSSPSSGITVRIHYVTLGRSSYRARRGKVARFRVSSDAERIRWRLVRRGRGRPHRRDRPGRRGGAASSRVKRGRHVLQVTANGHSDEATVFVRPR